LQLLHEPAVYSSASESCVPNLIFAQGLALIEPFHNRRMNLRAAFPKSRVAGSGLRIADEVADVTRVGNVRCHPEIVHRDTRALEGVGRRGHCRRHVGVDSVNEHPNV
jgi:hypothetical protein